ncbi:hypothetical protein FHS03_005254 [Massilia violacea]|uniref:Uncharacterized protein n=1 Tax=Pseudoduganella violacea TaxID=1715466 RepID=A0A7W5BFC4_9BURK|nr:hypothetical protein [Pseudoduganella violacea]
MKLFGALFPTLLVTGLFVGIVYLAKYIIHRFLDHK